MAGSYTPTLEESENFPCKSTLRREGYTISRKRIRRLMAKMGLEPIYQRPRRTVPHPDHQVYPYLLLELAIERPNHVW